MQADFYILFTAVYPCLAAEYSPVLIITHFFAHCKTFSKYILGRFHQMVYKIDRLFFPWKETLLQWYFIEYRISLPIAMVNSANPTLRSKILFKP